MTNATASFRADELPPSIADQLDGRYVAPRRFDRDHLAAFLARVEDEPGHLVIDGSQVEFVDLAAHRALAEALRRGQITLLDPSEALLLTGDLVISSARKPFGAAA